MHCLNILRAVFFIRQRAMSLRLLHIIYIYAHACAGFVFMITRDYSQRKFACVYQAACTGCRLRMMYRCADLAARCQLFRG